MSRPFPLKASYTRDRKPGHAPPSGTSFVESPCRQHLLLLLLLNELTTSRCLLPTLPKMILSLLPPRLLLRFSNVN